jgi:hypothetical protein
VHCPGPHRAPGSTRSPPAAARGPPPVCQRAALGFGLSSGDEADESSDAAPQRCPRPCSRQNPPGWNPSNPGWVSNALSIKPCAQRLPVPGRSPAYQGAVRAPLGESAQPGAPDGSPGGTPGSWSVGMPRVARSAIRRSDARDPCGGARPRWPGPPGCACAAGIRASSRGDDCSAGKCAYPCSRSDLPVTSGTMATVAMVRSDVRRSQATTTVSGGRTARDARIRTRRHARSISGGLFEGTQTAESTCNRGHHFATS